MVRDDFPERAVIRRGFSREELSEITAWLIQQTGNPNFWEDCHVEDDSAKTVFYFKDTQLALHLKLRWDSGRDH